MSAVAELIDLSPALSVALVGGVLSLLPLAWVAWRQRSTKFISVPFFDINK